MIGSRSRDGVDRDSMLLLSSRFSILCIGRARVKMVGFSITSQTSMLQTLNQKVVGAGAALPNIYTMRPEDLARLMNAYREQALRRAGRAAGPPDDHPALRRSFGRKATRHD